MPLHGERALVPSPVRVRGRLEGEPREVVRAAVAVAVALAERPEDEPAAEVWRGWSAPAVVEPALLAERTGLSPTEVESALAALGAAGVLRREAGAAERATLDPEILAELPSLARAPWPTVRDRLRARGGGWAVPLALYQELTLQGGAASADSPGRWVQCSVATLADAMGYGRTAITQALAALDEAGLLERSAQPARRALRLRLRPVAPAPSPAATGRAGDAAAEAPAAGGAEPLTVVVNGVSLVLGPGSRLEVGDGASVRLERDASGVMRAVVR